MRQQIVIISILISLAVTLQVVKWISFPDAVGYTSYGFDSLILILLIVPGVMALNQLYLRYINHHQPIMPGIGSERPNRRRSYRVTYPSRHRPKLIINQTDRYLRRELEFAVIDLSQDGACFNDDGSLGPTGRITGYLQIDNEKSLPVSGNIVRLKGNQVCIQFLHPIAWTTLVAEQRRLLQIIPRGGA